MKLKWMGRNKGYKRNEVKPKIKIRLPLYFSINATLTHTNIF